MRNQKVAFLILMLLPLLAGGVMKAQAKEQEKIPIYNARTGKVEQMEKVNRTDEEWKKILTPEQFRVTRLKDTERAFSKQCWCGYKRPD